MSPNLNEFRNRRNTGNLHCNVVILVSYISALNGMMEIEKTKRKSTQHLKRCMQQVVI